MALLAGVHTREDHHKLLAELIRSLVAGNDILIGILGISFGCGRVLRMSLFFHGDAHISFDFELHGRIVSLPIEEWSVAILLAIEVILEREDVIGGVLVHRRIRIGANNEGCITAISDNDYGNHQHGRVHHASREEVFFLQEKAGQKENQNDANNGTLHEEKCSREGQCEHETDIHAQARFL